MYFFQSFVIHGLIFASFIFYLIFSSFPYFSCPRISSFSFLFHSLLFFLFSFPQFLLYLIFQDIIRFFISLIFQSVFLSFLFFLFLFFPSSFFLFALFFTSLVSPFLHFRFPVFLHLLIFSSGNLSFLSTFPKSVSFIIAFLVIFLRTFQYLPSLYKQTGSPLW